VYDRVSTMIPDDIPPPLGKEVVITIYVDANLYHYLIPDHAATGICTWSMSGSPADWYSKYQALLSLQHMVLSLLLP